MTADEAAALAADTRPPLTVEEFARAVGLKRSTTYMRIAEREINVLRDGRRIMIPASEVAAYRRRRLVPAVTV